MSWQITKEAWLKPLQALAGTVSPRAVSPIFSHILLHFQETQMEMYGGDGHGQLFCRAPLVSSDGKDACCVQGKRLIDIVKSMPEGSIIEVKMVENRLQFCSGKSRFLLPTQAADQFPLFGKIQEKLLLSFSAAEIHALLAQIHYAIAHDDVRAFMNGVLWNWKDSKLELVATDGHRLAWVYHQLALPKAQPCQVIIPRRVVQEWLRLTDLFGQRVSIKIGEKSSVLIGEGYAYAAYHLDAVFPDYHQVIPKLAQNNLQVKRMDWRQALMRVRVMAHEKNQGVRVSIEQNTMNISAHSALQEQAEETIDLLQPTSKWVVGFNAGYLLDVLQVYPENQVDACWPDDQSLIVFRWQITQPLQAECGCLVMPLTL